MNIDRRLMFLGVIIVVLSMTMATQYATTKISYHYAIVHPSDADIRFIASDNSSAGGRVLRVPVNSSTQKYLMLELGNWSANQNKTYTAAFAIVNEENFMVNITYVNVSGADGSSAHMDIWLHSNRTTDAATEPSSSRVKVVEDGSAIQDANAVVWQLAAGNGDSTDINHNGSASISTPWESTSSIRYYEGDAMALNQTADFVWVQITIDISPSATALPSATGQIWVHFQASTHN